MGLGKIQEDIKKLLNHKDVKTAEDFIKKEQWDDLLYLLDEIIDDANVDVVIASEEDNGQLMREKSETLDQLMKLKFEVEDYVEEFEIPEEDNYDF